MMLDKETREMILKSVKNNWAEESWQLICAFVFHISKKEVFLRHGS